LIVVPPIEAASAARNEPALNGLVTTLLVAAATVAADLAAVVMPVIVGVVILGVVVVVVGVAVVVELGAPKPPRNGIAPVDGALSVASELSKIRLAA
jgi:type III secretory pathway component EscU